MARANVFDANFGYDESDPEGYRSGMARVGQSAGGRDLNVNLYELPPGEALCPYHYEYEEEWLLVLEGTIELRRPDGTEEARRGDLVCFPPGAAGAHKTTNRGSEPARILMFSSAHEPAVAVYPDSDKVGVWTPDDQDRIMVRRGEAHLDYWNGER